MEIWESANLHTGKEKVEQYNRTS